MSVVDDITSRIAALQQMFSGLSADGTQAGGLAVSSDDSSTASTSGATVSFGSELESALAAEADPADATGALEVPSAGSTSTTSSVTGQAVVTDAEKYLGVPYLYGGTDPSKGLDCSALVQRAYGDLGVSLPRTSQEQALQGVAVPSLADAQPGDLVCFGSPATHIGIYVGDGKMIDAPHTGTSVQIQSVGTPTSIRRIVGTSGTTITAASLAARPAALGGLGSTSSISNASTSSYPNGPGAYAAQFAAAEQKYDLPSGLLSAVAHAESNYDPSAVSSAGAVGLMQLMPETANALGVDPTNPNASIDAAGRLLQGEIVKYGSVPLALAAYNAGGPAVDKYGGIPPYPQTQSYVQKVMSYLGEAS